MRFHQGQSLTEYALICGMCGLAAIGSLVLLGNNLNASFGNLLEPRTPDIQAVPHSQATLQVSNTQGMGTSASLDLRNRSPEEQEAMTQFLRSGDMGRLVETAGANGSSEILLGMMDALIKEKLAAGELTQEQANILQDLSNKGHAIAAVEKLAEQKVLEGIAAGQTGAEILKQKVDYNGETLTVEDVYNLIGSTKYPDWANGLSRSEFNTSNANPMTADFYETYLDIQDQGLLNEPEASQVVSYLSNQIAGMSEGLSEYLGEMVKNPGSRPTAARMTQKIVSLTTDMHSAGICTSGSGTDSGTYCQ